ncbi:MAG: hypothetical protein Q7K54_01155 [Candidatus Parcubacteria bacterium]|nr:hypothetical protein [Candidatus Parcubacteria bacterium]
MSSNNTKLFIGSFILLAYIGIGVFGLLRFSHMSAMPMANCPYAENSFSVCDNSFEHISNWQQFSNIVFTSLFTLSFLFLGLVLYFFNKQNFLNYQHQFFSRWLYYLNNNKLFSFKETITKWLSLFENSPSFVYVRHS